MTMITVKYSCQACGLERIDLQVPARSNEDVVVWMDQTVLATWADHARRSPHCRPSTLSELLIPNTGTDRIGGPTLQ